MAERRVLAHMRGEAAEYLRIDRGMAKFPVAKEPRIPMNKTILAVILATTFTGSAFAQVIETPNNTAVIVPPGAPGVVTPQLGSTGAPGAANYSPSGQPADAISTNSSAAGNANQPSRVAPQGGGGGGGGSGQ